MEGDSLTRKTWQGTSISDICKNENHWSFAVTPIVPSKYHCVLYEFPLNTFQIPPKPHYSSKSQTWDDDYVHMPYSDKNLFPVSENGTNVIKLRWQIITEVLSQPLRTSHDFEHALGKYNTSLPKFEALHYFFNEVLEKEESDIFFQDILPKIVKLALRLPELVPSGIPLLQRYHNRSISISQLQVACILANAFLCTFPWKKNIARSYPGINFVSLFSSFSRVERRECICEKFKCIFNYFRRVVHDSPKGVITFERKFISKSVMPRWDRVDNNLGNTRVHVSSTGTIEDNGLGFLQVDFANKNIGGGVLRYGCVQEEIRFVLCPELLISRLFVEQLENGEAVIITGAERYNNYSGYGETFKWKSNHVDETPLDMYGRKKTTICVIDATHFTRPRDQFQSSLLIRELNKAYVGFSSREKQRLAPVATGNWGCGAFQGSKQLKTLIQLMACSVAGRDLVYYSFGDEELMNSFYNTYLFLATHQITVAQLWRFLCQFAVANLDQDKLYSFIQQAYFDSKKQPVISIFFKPSNNDVEKKDKQSLAVASTSSKIIPMEQTSPKRSKIEEQCMDVVNESLSEDIIPSSQPETKTFCKVTKVKTKKSPEEILAKMPQSDIGNIFDILSGNDSQTEDDKKKYPNDSGYLAVFDKFTTKDANQVVLEQVVVIKDEQIKGDSTSLHSNQQVTKTKITDYFVKNEK